MPQPPSADIISLMSESVSDMLNGPPSDPDAQATVNDFLDYTEYLPSDLTRSLTLIRHLDHRYLDYSAAVHDLTRAYGSLSTGNPAADPLALREAISTNLIKASSARESAFAEASRLLNAVDRHHDRLSSIITKLKALPKPPSRDPTPVPLAQALPQRTKSGRKITGPKITLRLDGARSAARPSGSGSRHKHRARRITIPGEVLPPPNPDSPVYSSESDWSSEPPSPIPIPTSRVGASRSRNVKAPKPPKAPKIPKLKPPKPPRRPRPPGVMGTNVHSAIAGISTSNALALLKPPPEDAVPGTSDAPWLKLTPWEMAKLRKRMKKNAVWSPSETMIRRELSQLSRGPENYLLAKAKAEEAGEPFVDHANIDTSDGNSHNQPLAEGEIGIASLRADEIQLSNRGMKLNEAKKLKKEQAARELAGLAALEADQAAPPPPVPVKSTRKPSNAKSRATAAAAEQAERAARALAATSSALRNIFPRPAETVSSPSRPQKAATKPRNRKRKRSVGASQGDELSSQLSPLSPATTIDGKKRKLSPSLSSASAAPSIAQSTIPIPIQPAPVPSKAKNPTPQPQKSPIPTQAIAPKPVPVPTPPAVSKVTIKATSPTTTKISLTTRPRSQGTGTTSVPAPLQNTAGKDRPRRASTVPAAVAVLDEPGVRQTRSKRPAPGPVSKSEEGETKTTVGKRKTAPRKASATNKRASQGDDRNSPDDVDPDEPRYCTCGDVSWGQMIACENKDCEYEWFHMKCVGFPGTRAKWYCPDCCKKLGVGERGQATSTRSLRRSN